eukprot:scaffold53_cov193-Pinguiococcus_pyrenoidosus.AAC.4
MKRRTSRQRAYMDDPPASLRGRSTLPEQEGDEGEDEPDGQVHDHSDEHAKQKLRQAFIPAHGHANAHEDDVPVRRPLGEALASSKGSPEQVSCLSHSVRAEEAQRPVGFSHLPRAASALQHQSPSLRHHQKQKDSHLRLHLLLLRVQGHLRVLSLGLPVLALFVAGEPAFPPQTRT